MHLNGVTFVLFCTSEVSAELYAEARKALNGCAQPCVCFCNPSFDGAKICCVPDLPGKFLWTLQARSERVGTHILSEMREALSGLPEAITEICVHAASNRVIALAKALLSADAPPEEVAQIERALKARGKLVRIRDGRLLQDGSVFQVSQASEESRNKWWERELAAAGLDN